MFLYNKDVNQPIQIAFLVITIVFFIIHLIFCFFEKHTLRAITKPFCLLSLMGFGISLKPVFDPLWIALSLGIIGDVLLIFKGKKILFTLGAFFFWFSHLAYGFKIATLFNNNEPWFYIVIISSLLVAMFGTMFLLRKKLKPIIKDLTELSLLYIGTLFFMIALSAVLTFIYPDYRVGLLIFVGYILFLISDSTLMFTVFAKEFKRQDFYIMLTYLGAEAFITFGILISLGAI